MTNGSKLIAEVALDSSETDAPATETSEVILLSGANAVLIAVLLYALTATSVVMQIQISVDGFNWVNKGSSQSMTGIGRKLFTAETAVAAPYVRVKFSLTGTGKAILRAMASLSQQ